MTTNKIPTLIFGTGAVSAEAAYLIEEINAQSQENFYDILGFVGEKEEAVGQIYGKYGVCTWDGGVAEYAKEYRQLAGVLAIADPQIRQKIYQKVKSISHLEFPNFIHPQVNTRNLVLGAGNIIQENVSISIQIVMGDFNFINYAAFLGHDVRIGDFCVVNPQANLCGNVCLGNQAFVGVGATVLQNLRIGSKAVIGAGAVVTKDVEDMQTVVGIPARPVSEKSSIC